MFIKSIQIILFFCIIFLLLSPEIKAQQYLNLPSYHNANNEIGIAGNNYILKQSSNLPFDFQEVNLQDTSYTYSNFRICDSETGTLLFYTKKLIMDRNNNDYFDLFNIYNHDNEIIENGRFEYSLLDEGKVDYLCVVPVINNDKKFYLFYTQENLNESGLYYAIIDMSRNNGKGGIAPHEKAIKIRNGYSFATSVPGNKCNYYLITFNHGFNRSFITYEIDINGINETPVQQYSMENVGINKSFKKISISSDRRFIGFSDARQEKTIGDGRVEANLLYSYLVLKFNPEIGIIESNVSGGGLIGEGNPSFENYLFTSNIFSPDNRFFYISINTAENKLKNLFKYDLQDFLNYKVNNSVVDIKDSLRVKFPIEFYIYKNQLLTAFSNIVGTSVITTQPYTEFHSILPTSDTILQFNVNGKKRPLPNDLNSYSIFSRPINYVFSNTDTIQSTVMDSIFCADTFSIVLSKDSGSNFHWSNGDTGSFTTVDDYGTYWVTYKGECSYRMDSFTLYDKRKDIELIKFDTIVCEQRFPFDISNPNKADHYYWNGSEGSNKIRVYEPSDSFIAAFKIDNCLVTDTIRIQSKGWCPCDTYIPNAFTPNNDGLNDYFKPIFLGGCVPLQYHFAIYDRWGELVYKSNREFDDGWNGEKNGKPLPTGVYFYQIFFNSNSLDQPFNEKGTVHLIR